MRSIPKTLRLYPFETSEQRAWPLFARALRDHLFQVACEDGTLLVGCDAPGKAIGKALKAEDGAAVEQAVELMLLDGYLALADGRLYITSLDAQRLV